MPKVRITAFPVSWLTRSDSFANSTRIDWSTGEKTQRGDIQIFAVSATLDQRDLADDPRRDAVHSIWQAMTSPLDEYFYEEEWSIQAKFKLLVKLETPFSKAELVRTGLLKGAWPRGSRGKLLKSESEIKTLADVLSKKNPKQRLAIFEALGLHSATHGKGTIILKEKRAKVTDGGEVAIEEAFVEGEKRAVSATVRNPRLRTAAKMRWGLKCYCCGFDFEHFYGDIAKGLAVVHHLQVFAQANGRRRSATVEDVRVVCANCHFVVHVEKPPIDADKLKNRISDSWTQWTEKGIAQRK